MIRYYLCEFEYGYEGQFYQILDLNTETGFVRFADLQGNTLNLEGAFGYYIINDNPPLPDWA